MAFPKVNQFFVFRFVLWFIIYPLGCYMAKTLYPNSPIWVYFTGAMAVLAHEFICLRFEIKTKRKELYERIERFQEDMRRFDESNIYRD